MTEVRVGQIWADNDWRAEGRTLRVDKVDRDYAYCTVLTNPTKAQARLDAGNRSDVRDMRGKPTRIRLDRFRPTSTGYRLVAEAMSGDDDA